MNLNLQKESKHYAPNPELEKLKNQIVELKVAELEQKFFSKDKDFFTQVDRSRKYKNWEILKRVKSRLEARNSKISASKKYEKFYAYLDNNSSFTC